ncbi:putative acetyl-CoA acetyltransferase OS=Streptomyces tendae OX=1932 GN=GUR47_02350 PE=3 SV=1 [Streptomyces tendae]
MTRLKPCFREENGTVTAGNAPPRNDGAAALLLVDSEGLKAAGREPLTRVSATGVSALDPHFFGLDPDEPSPALSTSGKSFHDDPRWS